MIVGKMIDHLFLHFLFSCFNFSMTLTVVMSPAVKNSDAEGVGGVSDEVLTALEEKAEELLVAATHRFDKTYRQQNASKAKWFEEVARAGTFADRMSMLQLRVKQSPMFSLGHVEKLLESLPKKGHRESHTTLSLLRDLFLQDYLPSDRKLIPFERRPLKEVVKILSGKLSGEKAKEVEEKLIEWKYESNLKACYTKFLASVESNASSSLEGIAETGCATLLRLLIERPEQESFLLSALVNKLGHPSRRVASRVAQHLCELAQAHGNMRLVIVNEVSQLVFRKNISERAQYYAVHFLSRLYLQAGEYDLAYTLIKNYLNLFKIVIAKCEHDHSLIPLLITGINRAVPYARSLFFEKNGLLGGEIDSLYSLVHNSKFSIALNVLKLLFKIHCGSDGLPDRFYASFYRRLLFVTPSSLNRQFFAFFLQAVKGDGVEVRARAFLKRLLQIALASSTPEFTIATLMLVDMVVRERPNLLVLSKPANKAKPNGVNIPQYNPMVRNPLFANATLALDVELFALSTHYHPTVQIFAKKIIAGEPIKYDSDPLEDFTAMNFIERFAFKNPKRKQQKKTKSEEKDDDDNSNDDDEMDVDGEKLDNFEEAEDDGSESDIEIGDPSDVDDPSDAEGLSNMEDPSDVDESSDDDDLNDVNDASDDENDDL